MAVNLELIDAASVLIVRDNEQTGAFEVLMVRRHPDIDFAGGAYVFPGGKVDVADIELSEPVPSFPIGYSELTHTAYREVLEETGLLIGRGENISFYRNALIKEEISFIEFMIKASVTFNVDDLVPFARWITPKTYTKRFDTRFYLARAPKDQYAIPDGHEVIESTWVEPIDFINKNIDKMMFPTLMNLKLLADATNVEEAIKYARTRKTIIIEPKIKNGIRIIDPAAGYGEVNQEKIHQGFK